MNAGLSALLLGLDAGIADLTSLSAVVLATHRQLVAAIEAEQARIYGDRALTDLTRPELDHLDVLDAIDVPDDSDVDSAIRALHDLRRALVKAQRRCERAGIAVDAVAEEGK